MKYTEHDDLIEVEIMSGEDLWYVSLILRPGDIIVADVLRRVERKEDVIRNKKTEREKIKVSIRIESTEFMELSSRLHILGEIVGGPEDYMGEHQSINVESSSSLSVHPLEWSAFMRNLEESSSLTNSSVLVLSTDDQNVTLYGINESKNDLLWRIPTGSGKMYEGKESSIRFEFLENLERFRQSDIYIIGPSIFRDSTSKLLVQNGFRTINTQIGSSEEDGIRELLQEGVINLRRSAESKLIADFLRGVAKGKSSYGRTEIERALDVRAVSTLLMSDKFFRSRPAAGFMNKCYQGGCKLFVVHSSWETGKIVESYGGVVAILRYRMDYSSA